MSDYDYDELADWQDILDDVVCGRTDGLVCPFCGKKAIEVNTEGPSIEIKCTECGRWIEGQNAF
ncbi:MAG: hypothetical protein IIY06_13775 [Proteobacteria bacterium]|jgi:hypothetical protein|nr:hypothetical protein [Pseudomonadota bacterium]